jgi:hypothetical protein
VVGRYFSIIATKSFSEQGFLSISLIPLSFISSNNLLLDEAVKITMFLDSIHPSSFNEFIKSNPLNSGMAKSNRIRSYFSS